MSGISAVTSIDLQAAFARFDRAASTVVQSASSDASDPGELASAITTMMSEKLALRAALEVARTSNEMITDALKQLDA